MLGRFEKQIAVNGRREAGDDDGRYIFQWQGLVLFAGHFAGQLAVFAAKRTLRRVYADYVVRHAFLSASDSDVLTKRRAPAARRKSRASIIRPSKLVNNPRYLC